MSTIPELKEAADLAERAMRLAQSNKERTIRARVDAFKALVEVEETANFDAQILVTTRAYVDSVAARDAAIDAAARAGEGTPFPVGTKVFEWRAASRWFYSREIGLIRGKAGVIEVITTYSKHPDNKAAYRMAALGEPVVRILKKDGTPGLQYEKLIKNYGDKDYRLPWGWHFEGVDPNKKEPKA